ncbi:aldo/keto reductase [Nocardia sp. NPDC088792]|uniref:aldo/keto reductase n=1 Tax=Nocardia sp. NPDC088792 TaxID=3364332 RepID=UPI00382AC9A1
MTTSSALPTTALGSDGTRVSVQGYGAMGISEFYGPTDSTEARATLEQALSLGITMFDTSDAYGIGHNDQFVGPFIRAHRESVLLATKFGLVRRVDDPDYRGIDNSPAYLRKAVDASLRRLGIDVIDLYYMHRKQPGVPVEDTVAVMAELVAAGKVRQLGLSEVTGPELRAACAVHPIAAVQSEWSLFSRDVENTAVPAAAELGVTFVAYAPLSRGFLAGNIIAEHDLPAGDIRRTLPRFIGANARTNAELLAPVREIAEARGITTAQVALAWVHSRARRHGLSVVPIPGTRHRARVIENVAAATIELTDDELAALEPIASRVAGTRYSDMAFASAGRE